MLIWSSVEVMVTVLCSSIPVLRAFYVHFFRGGKESSYKNHGSNTYGSNSRGLGHSKGYPLEDFSNAGKSGGSGRATGMHGTFGADDDLFRTNVEGTRFQTNSSEESILGQAPPPGTHGITKTQQIVVSYGTKESHGADGHIA